VELTQNGTKDPLGWRFLEGWDIFNLTCLVQFLEGEEKCDINVIITLTKLSLILC